MQTVDIVFLYEHVARELDVACAVKALAKQHYGLHVEIVQWPYGVPQAVDRFRPRVLVLPAFYQQVELFYDYCLLYWRKSILFNMAWEQLLYEGNLEAKTPGGEFAINYVIHHAWSDLFASHLQAHGIKRERIFTNGHPAYALYDGPYRRYFKSRADLASEYQIDIQKKWVFFPENYNWMFFTEARLEGLSRRGLSLDEMNAMRHFCRQSLTMVMQWCHSVVLHHNDIELIVRPRPSTPINEFVEAVQQVIPTIPGRMHFTKGESVREWILASDVVVSSHSTSLIEAAVAGKPAYMLEPYPIPRPFSADWHSYVPHIKMQLEFENACLNSSRSDENSRLGVWARSTLMARGDAIWNLTAFLARLCRGEISSPPFPTRKSIIDRKRFGLPAWFLYEYRRIYWWWKRRTHCKEGSSVHKQDRTHESDVLTEAEVARRVERWSEVLRAYWSRA